MKGALTRSSVRAKTPDEARDAIAFRNIMWDVLEGVRHGEVSAKEAMACAEVGGRILQSALLDQIQYGDKRHPFGLGHSSAQRIEHVPENAAEISSQSGDESTSAGLNGTGPTAQERQTP